MRWVCLVVLLTGCREILGIDEAIGVPTVDAANDAGTTLPGTADAPTLACGTGMPPLQSVMYTEVTGAKKIQITVSDTNVSGQGAIVTAMPGQLLTVNAKVFISDCICTSCVDQVQVGFLDSSDKAGCLYDDNPPDATCSIGVSTDTQLHITAPQQPGLHSLGFRLGQDFQCTTNAGWWMGMPPSDAQVIAQICVVAP